MKNLKTLTTAEAHEIVKAEIEAGKAHKDDYEVLFHLILALHND